MGLKYTTVSVRSCGTEVHGRECAVLMGLKYTALSVRSCGTGSRP